MQATKDRRGEAGHRRLVLSAIESYHRPAGMIVGLSTLCGALLLYVSLAQLLACAATALVILPVYTFKVKSGGGGVAAAAAAGRPRTPCDGARPPSALSGAPSKHALILAAAARKAQRLGGAGARYLQPMPAHLQGRLTVVLDLDETLVCAYRESGAPAPLLAAHAAGASAAQGGGTFMIECEAAPGVRERVLVLPRPGLPAFLERLAAFAEVVVFTAALPGYAEPLLAAIDPGRRHVSACLCRGHTLQTSGRDYVKDLDRLGRDLRRCVLVDNNPYSFLLQPLNGIPIAPFSGDPRDAQLLGVLLPLLRGLASLPDVRPVLACKFRMPQWFRGRGYDVMPCLPDLPDDGTAAAA